MKNNKSPYPTTMEIIRIVLAALDMKQGIAKELDDQCKSVFVDYHVINHFIAKHLFENLERYSSPEHADILFHSLRHGIKQYHDLIRHVSLDWMPREVALKVLSEHWVSWILKEFTLSITNCFQGLPKYEILDPNKSSVGIILGWVEQTYPWWSDRRKKWSHTEITKVSKYRNGKELPTSLSIKQLFNGEGNEIRDVRFLLLIARACDYLKKKQDGPIILRTLIDHILCRRERYNVYEAISTEHIMFSQRNEVLTIPVMTLIEDLEPSKPKACNAQIELRKRLDELKGLFDLYDPTNETIYYLNWIEARWHVLAGDIEGAKSSYKNAFEQALYRAGENQEVILREALAVASMCNDSVFLKKLKQTAILFELNLPLANADADEGIQRTKTSDFIEDWEVSNWQAYFKKVFPRDGWFDGTVYEDEGRIGPEFYVRGENQPDYKRVNRKIALQRKSYPQLVFFAKVGKAEVVQKLLESGANVNKLSSSNESALLMAIERLDCFEVTNNSFDDTLFSLLIEHKHTIKTLNAITSKLKLTPLFSAINSCRVDIVRKIVEAGASVNRRAGQHMWTPLYHCLNRIAYARNPERMLSQEIDKETLEAIRRSTNGMLGPTLKDQSQALNNMINDSWEANCWDALMECAVELIKERSDVDGLRAIALYLIEKGADCSLPENYPLKGYTPLMSAVELDEVSLVNKMIENGADLDQAYVDPRTGRMVNCWQIALYFQSRNVLEAIVPLGN